MRPRTSHPAPLVILLAVLLAPAWAPAQEPGAESPGPAPPETPPVEEAAPEPFPYDRGSEVYLSTSEGLARIKIALPTPEAAEAFQGSGGNLMEITRNDLHFSGMFQIVDPSLYDLVLRDIQEGEPRPLTMKRWRSVGADYLATARLSGGEDGIILEVYLVDLLSGDKVLGKRYRSSPDQARQMAHHLSEDLLNYFTGSGSVFTTRLVYASRRGNAQEIYVADYDGANERAVTTTRSLNLSPTVSPDGTVVAFTSFVSGGPRLHLTDLRTGSTRQLLECTGTCQSPAWSPDGKVIAYSSSVEGNSEIYLLPRDGSTPSRLTRHPAIDVSPVWSPTGREIAFVSDRAGRPQIYVMDAHGLSVRRLTYAFEQATDPAWSPQGDKIAFTGRVERRNRVCVLDLASGDESCLPPVGSGEEGPAWSPDGNYFVFVARKSGTTALHLRRADGQGEAWPVYLRGEPKTPSWYR